MGESHPIIDNHNKFAGTVPNAVIIPNINRTYSQQIHPMVMTSATTTTTNFTQLLTPASTIPQVLVDDVTEEDRKTTTNDHPSDIVLLGIQLLGDIGVAITVTAIAAPFLTIIDKALVQRSAAQAVATATTTSIHHRISTVIPTTTTVWSSMKSSFIHMIYHPIQFVRSPTYLWMWGTYAVTYIAANTLRTIISTPILHNHNVRTNTSSSGGSSSSSSSCIHQHPRLDIVSDSSKNNSTTTPQRPIQVWWSSGTMLLMGTSIVNSTASICKDRAFAQFYGNHTTTTTTPTNTTTTITKRTSFLPNITLGLWMLRDLTVIGAAFVLPNHVARIWQQQQQQISTNSNYHHQYHLSDASILRISQIATPVAAQVVAGPLHFIGLDVYNRNLSHIPSIRQQLFERWKSLQASLGQVITARMIRIIPGYGIAGVLNTELRTQWHTNFAIRIHQQLSTIGYTGAFHTTWNHHHHHSDDNIAS